MIGRGVTSGGCQLRSPVRSGGLDDRAESSGPRAHRRPPGLPGLRTRANSAYTGASSSTWVRARPETTRSASAVGNGSAVSSPPAKATSAARALARASIAAELSTPIAWKPRAASWMARRPAPHHGVDRPALRQLGDDGGDQRLVEIEQAVVFAVVGRGPTARTRSSVASGSISTPGCEASSGSSSSERDRSQSLPHEALTEVLVHQTRPVAGPESLQPQQVGEWLLIDHPRTLADATALFHRTSVLRRRNPGAVCLQIRSGGSGTAGWSFPPPDHRASRTWSPRPSAASAVRSWASHSAPSRWPSGSWSPGPSARRDHGEHEEPALAGARDRHPDSGR